MVGLPSRSIRGKAALALFGVLDDRCGIARPVREPMAPWLMDELVRDTSQFFNVATDIAAVRIKALRLCRRIEDPEVRCGVRARSSYPLPVELVAREIAVHEVLNKVRGATVGR